MFLNTLVALFFTLLTLTSFHAPSSVHVHAGYYIKSIDTRITVGAHSVGRCTGRIVELVQFVWDGNHGNFSRVNRVVRTKALQGSSTSISLIDYSVTSMTPDVTSPTFVNDQPVIRNGVLNLMVDLKREMTTSVMLELRYALGGMVTTNTKGKVNNVRWIYDFRNPIDDLNMGGGTLGSGLISEIKTTFFFPSYWFTQFTSEAIKVSPGEYYDSRGATSVTMIKTAHDLNVAYAVKSTVPNVEPHCAEKTSGMSEKTKKKLVGFVSSFGGAAVLICLCACCIVFGVGGSRASGGGGGGGGGGVLTLMGGWQTFSQTWDGKWKDNVTGVIHTRRPY